MDRHVKVMQNISYKYLALIIHVPITGEAGGPQWCTLYHILKLRQIGYVCHYNNVITTAFAI